MHYRRPNVGWYTAAMQHRTTAVSNAVKLVSACLIVAGLYGCGADGTTPPTPQASAQQTLQPATPAKATAQNANAPAAALPSAMNNAGPVMPEGAKYTIICTAFGGAGHVAEAKAAKDKLIAKTGRNEFYVIHEENLSTLYFGYYKAILRAENPAEAKRCDEDIAFVRSLTDSSGRKLFPRSLKEVLPVPDPAAPPEYDLAKIDRDKSPDDPARRYWSLAIAAYTVDAQPTGIDAGKSRKQLAVETVLAARKQGIEAYYYNGENVSTVCIGAWPRSAVAEQQAGAVDAKHNGDSDQAIVLSTVPLPPGMTEQLENSGRNVKVFQPKINVTDPSLLNAMKAYPQYYVNGAPQNNRMNDPATGQSVVKPQPTFLVEIPRLQPSAISASENENAAPTQDNSGPSNLVNPLGPGSGSGRLRSLSH